MNISHHSGLVMLHLLTQAFAMEFEVVVIVDAVVVVEIIFELS